MGLDCIEEITQTKRLSRFMTSSDDVEREEMLSRFGAGQALGNCQSPGHRAVTVNSGSPIPSRHNVHRRSYPPTCRPKCLHNLPACQDPCPTSTRLNIFVRAAHHPPDIALQRQTTMASYLRKTYLIVYNAASAVAWATVLGRVLAVLYLKGNPGSVPVAVDTFVRNTQTFAVLEILHSILGSSLLQ
jgi:hypothetical protein